MQHISWRIDVDCHHIWWWVRGFTVIFLHIFCRSSLPQKQMSFKLQANSVIFRAILFLFANSTYLPSFRKSSSRSLPSLSSQQVNKVEAQQHVQRGMVPAIRRTGMYYSARRPRASSASIWLDGTSPEGSLTHCLTHTHTHTSSSGAPASFSSLFLYQVQ